MPARKKGAPRSRKQKANVTWIKPEDIAPPVDDWETDLDSFVGRPRLFSRPMDMRDRLVNYYNRRRAEFKPMTIAGVAEALGISKDAYCDYRNRSGFHLMLGKFETRMENHNDDLFFAESATKALQVIMKRVHDREMLERELEIAGNSNPDVARMLADRDLRYEEYELHREKLYTDAKYRAQVRKDIIASGQRQLDEIDRIENPPSSKSSSPSLPSPSE